MKYRVTFTVDVHAERPEVAGDLALREMEVYLAWLRLEEDREYPPGFEGVTTSIVPAPIE